MLRGKFAVDWWKICLPMVLSSAKHLKLNLLYMSISDMPKSVFRFTNFKNKLSASFKFVASLIPFL